MVDRYAYSGIAYSVAKGVDGLDMAWCSAPEKGLPQPDVVIFLRVPQKETEGRAGFGGERYEEATLQARVRGAFEEMRSGIASGPSGSSLWRDIDGTGDVETVSGRVMGVARGAVDAAATGEPLRELWDRD